MPQNTLNTASEGLLSHDLIQTWLLNTTALNSRLAKRSDLLDFTHYMGIHSVEDFKTLERADIINWRDSLAKDEKDKPALSIRSVKRRLATISKLFEFLCDEGFTKTNIVLGVERPKLTANEGVTQVINDAQARRILEAPDPNTLIGKRDRAILATFMFHALRRSELCQLKVKDVLEREGIKQFMIHGKGSKDRYIPIHPAATRRINEYLEADEPQHANDKEAPIFKSISNNGKNSDKGISPISIYRLVLHYGRLAGIDMGCFSPHSLRATAATNALKNGEDIRKVQHWLGHASIQTTAMYDKRDHRPEDSPTYRVRY